MWSRTRRPRPSPGSKPAGMNMRSASLWPGRREPQIVQNQVDAGIASRVDLTQAQTLYQQARSLLVAEGINRAIFEHAIAVLIGKAPSEFNLESGVPPQNVPTVDAGIPSLQAATQAARGICEARFKAFGCEGQAAKIKPLALDLMVQRYA